MVATNKMVTTAMSTSPRYIWEVSRLAWGLGLRIEPSKRSNNNNNHNRGRGRPSERGTDGQLDKAETQPCSGTLPHGRAGIGPTYHLPACVVSSYE